MKVLLIAPFLSSKDTGWARLGKIGPKSEPLNLAYLGAALKQHNYQVKILDCEALQYTQTEVEQYLGENSYDVIGVTMLTPTYPQALEVIKTVKRVASQSVLIVGGAHPTILPKETMEHNPEIDYAVIGEGEITIIELLEGIEHKRPLPGIKGIAYRNNENEVVITPPREFISDLDMVPIPDRSLLPMEIYRPSISYYEKLPAYIILTARGCPYRCTYCSKIFGNHYRHHSVDRIVKEMKILIEQYGAKEILFRDDTFTIDKKFINQLCRRIIEEDLHRKIRWSCMTRVNLIQQDLLKTMKKAGCWGIHYGVESGSQRLLDIIRKGITLDQVRDAFRWTKEAKIKSRAFFMLGLPTETPAESEQTIQFAKELDAHWTQFTITTPYPGTELYYIAKEHGELKSIDWKRYYTWAGFTNQDLVYVTSGRTSDELKNTQKRALKEFYFRPKVILRHLFSSNFIHMFKKYLFGALALFSFGKNNKAD